VLLTFDRRIDPATVVTPGDQFTFSGGLTATAAQVTGRQITVTTSDQTPGTNYTVTVANTVKDLSGTSVSATANTATFRGFREPAVLRITEIQPNMPNNGDLVELVAVSGGTVDGFVLQQDFTVSTPVVTLATFPNATVATGDVIVVHIAPPGGYTGETTAKDQFPQSGTTINYDTAWDFAGGTTGITFSSRVLVVRNQRTAVECCATSSRRLRRWRCRPTGRPCLPLRRPSPRIATRSAGSPTTITTTRVTGQWVLRAGVCLPRSPRLNHPVHG
jgi:hypothetical protein